VETESLSLSGQELPLPCSLHEPVMQRYAAPGDPEMQAMEIEDLLGYLRDPQDLAATPLQWVLSRAGASGDPAVPGAAHNALLAWVGRAFDDWEESCTMERPLLGELRKLKPLAAALAIADPQFLIPGGHPLHLILDRLQQAAVGWQASLGRTAGPLQLLVRDAVQAALAWFDNRALDLGEVCGEVVAAVERDQARAERMSQRMIETELGRLKTAGARQQAAAMINGCLRQQPVPQAIARFLKGPWYDSAQLVLLKFGADSEQWAHVTETTTTLMSSLGVDSGGDEPGRRQQLFETVTRLPRELRRWLLSLQHDSNAIDTALGAIEYVHVQILRQRPLELEQAELLSTVSGSADESDLSTLEQVETGRWYRFDLDGAEPLRARLVLRVEVAGQLLFANLAGVKVLQQSFDQFAELLDQGRVTPLESGASFSRALAAAAGIETMAQVNALQGPAAVQARREQEERQQKKPATGGSALPMGAWLGFHDSDPPLLARLAAHVLDSNEYTFVNRCGIRVRQLSHSHLLELMQQGQVDILETRSSFRDQIGRAKQQQDK